LGCAQTSSLTSPAFFRAKALQNAIIIEVFQKLKFLKNNIRRFLIVGIKKSAVYPPFLVFLGNYWGEVKPCSLAR
jgi:hypothetical protein